MVSKRRRDSVGGGVVAECLRDLRKPARFQWGRGSTIHFPLMGPFYIFWIFKRGGRAPPGSATVLVGVGLIMSFEVFGCEFGQVPYLRVFRTVLFRLLDRVCVL